MKFIARIGYDCSYHIYSWIFVCCYFSSFFYSSFSYHFRLYLFVCIVWLKYIYATYFQFTHTYIVISVKFIGILSSLGLFFPWFQPVSITKYGMSIVCMLCVGILTRYVQKKIILSLIARCSRALARSIARSFPFSLFGSFGFLVFVMCIQVVACF